jgi:hypothetical protein
VSFLLGKNIFFATINASKSKKVRHHWAVKEFISCGTPLCSLAGAESVAIGYLYKLKRQYFKDFLE